MIGRDEIMELRRRLAALEQRLPTAESVADAGGGLGLGLGLVIVEVTGTATGRGPYEASIYANGVYDADHATALDPIAETVDAYAVDQTVDGAWTIYQARYIGWYNSTRSAWEFLAGALVPEVA